MVYITKVDGRKEKFERKKVYGTCIRAGVPKKVASRISKEVENEIHEGISSRKILDIVLKKLDRYKSQHSALYNLKKALADLDPGDSQFEKYVRHILKEHGYKTRWNKIIQGECIEHQIDVIAEKDDKKYLVECKHHINPHRYSGLGTALQTWAVIDDMRKGFKKGKSKEKFENIWLVTNTKFSAHSIRYAKAKKMRLIGWDYPKGNDLRHLIKKKGIYPVTILDGNKKVIKKFTDKGILLIKEVNEKTVNELNNKTKISKKKLKKIKKAARKILKSG
ncbi:MAG: restriction endonuclease [Candidatus Undinarchaeales archaeon]